MTDGTLWVIFTVPCVLSVPSCFRETGKMPLKWWCFSVYYSVILFTFIDLITVGDTGHGWYWFVCCLDVPLRKCQMCKVAPVEAQPAQGALDGVVSAQAQEGHARRGAEETHTAHCQVPASYHWCNVK